VKAATKAIATCASNGYPVSAVVVDPSGVIKLEAKGDHSTIHTTTAGFRKAYTVVTFGPIFRFDASSTFAELVAKSPNGAVFSTLLTFYRSPAGLRSRPKVKSSVRSVSQVRWAATRMRPAPRPGSRASRTILQPHDECPEGSKERQT
jgi:heme-degrading protein